MKRGTILGITGSFGTGKSTVAALLARRGAQMIDADALAHELMRPRTPVWRRLRRRFGEAVIQPDGTIHRRALATAGFRSRGAWRDLCRIVHPAVIAAARRQIRAIHRRRPVAVIALDVPLLLESGMDRLVDIVVVVAADRRTQLARLRRKGWPLAEIRRRLRWQMPLAEKVRRADVVIQNSGSRRATAAHVQRLWDTIKTQNREK